MAKPRIIKDYEKLPEEIIAQIKLEYPYGFERKLILFKDPKGKLVSALPYEAEDYYYLIRMTRAEAQEIVNEDDDFDEQGNLTEEAIGKNEEIIEEIADEPDDN